MHGKDLLWKISNLRQFLGLRHFVATSPRCSDLCVLHICCVVHLLTSHSQVCHTFVLAGYVIE